MRYSAYAACAALGFFFFQTCVADELDDIQRARESAEIQYVNELASGKYKTKTEQDALKKKLVDPEERKTREYFERISVVPTPRVVKSEEVDIEQGNPKLVAPGNPSLPSGKSGSSAPSSEKGTLRPEFVLDGSNVPKEISFDSASPSPSPKPTPRASKKP